MFRLRNLVLQLLLSAGWILLATHSSVAQDSPYPSRPVRVIVPFAAGGPTDIAARLVADKLSKAWGQSVVVESRPGGGSMIGSAAVAQSSPDGYTILFGPSSALVEGTLISKDVPFDPIKSFAPVTEVYKLSAGLSINKKVPAADLKELIALARSKPLTYSSFGIGTGAHLLLETFKSAAGVDILHIPYKGNVPGLAAAVSGEVDMTGAGLGTIRPHLESGALKLLAVEAETRIEACSRRADLQGARISERQRRFAVHCRRGCRPARRLPSWTKPTRAFARRWTRRSSPAFSTDTPTRKPPPPHRKRSATWCEPRSSAGGRSSII